MTAIQERLFALQDAEYAAFQRPLMPTVGEETFIGVRTPALRSLLRSSWQSVRRTLARTSWSSCPIPETATCPRKGIFNVI